MCLKFKTNICDVVNDLFCGPCENETSFWRGPSDKHDLSFLQGFEYKNFYFYIQHLDNSVKLLGQ